MSENAPASHITPSVGTQLGVKGCYVFLNKSDITILSDMLEDEIGKLNLGPARLARVRLFWLMHVAWEAIK